MIWHIAKVIGVCLSGDINETRDTLLRKIKDMVNDERGIEGVEPLTDDVAIAVFECIQEPNEKHSPVVQLAKVLHNAFDGIQLEGSMSRHVARQVAQLIHDELQSIDQSIWLAHWQKLCSHIGCSSRVRKKDFSRHVCVPHHTDEDDTLPDKCPGCQYSLKKEYDTEVRANRDAGTFRLDQVNIVALALMRYVLGITDNKWEHDSTSD
ncbi:hypothetical protein SAMD00019534_113450 [Acytostelium subglobosum LB1]|uniref:hypothetical protein n=1 Tax=Acytostelium subglobosum LB1 TaxID=1410327 RepID=UPI000644954F|nr:hypothetical protein SAMD00019534_113450 [Acytostelium subglobosum LB1]GAM28169.1 hypothetical protein SAMD00019534_113450 [Acytostelium subglobosum LB1]|eukprot:XP_012748803.1 hypothetical protein SAMD00019534_113450 [Acytostelium subglobosum LB1]